MAFELLLQLRRRRQPPLGDSKSLSDPSLSEHADALRLRFFLTSAVRAAVPSSSAMRTCQDDRNLDRYRVAASLPTSCAPV